MTVEIISGSISTKVWDKTGIEISAPRYAVKHISTVRHDSLFWVSMDLTGYVWQLVTCPAADAFNTFKTKSNCTLLTTEYIFTVFDFNQIKYCNELLVLVLA